MMMSKMTSDNNKHGKRFRTTVLWTYWHDTVVCLSVRPSSLWRYAL